MNTSKVHQTASANQRSSWCQRTNKTQNGGHNPMSGIYPCQTPHPHPHLALWSTPQRPPTPARTHPEQVGDPATPTPCCNMGAGGWGPTLGTKKKKAKNRQIPKTLHLHYNNKSWSIFSVTTLKAGQRAVTTIKAGQLRKTTIKAGQYATCKTTMRNQ